MALTSPVVPKLICRPAHRLRAVGAAGPCVLCAGRSGLSRRGFLISWLSRSTMRWAGSGIYSSGPVGVGLGSPLSTQHKVAVWSAIVLGSASVPMPRAI